MKVYFKCIIVLVISTFFTACMGNNDNKKTVENTEIKSNNHSEMQGDNERSNDKELMNNNISLNTNKCKEVLESLGQFSEEKYIDYKSGFRIFPLLHFIMTKQSIPAKNPEESVYMEDNPIFVTNNDKYANSLLFATIHSKRTGVLQGVIGNYQNEVKRYYSPMVYGEDSGILPEIPSTDIGPLNKSVDVNRETWTKELKEYTKDCNGSLILPPTKTDYPFFQLHGAIYPFSKEIDFVAGAEGVGAGLIEYSTYYLRENSENINRIQIPILIYCPNCKIDNVVMLQENNILKFEKSDDYTEWHNWLGGDWHMYTSEKIQFDQQKFKKADFSNIHSNLPPFLSDSRSVIQVTINGEKVEYFNH